MTERYAIPLPHVTHIEIIDANGRAYVNMDTCEVTALLQDDGRTVKVFCAGTGSASQSGWKPIATAPKDRPIIVYAPPYDGLQEMASMGQWHPDAGFCIDELRQPTHWRDKP